jgi:hypothetical protein
MRQPVAQQINWSERLTPQSKSAQYRLRSQEPDRLTVVDLLPREPDSVQRGFVRINHRCYRRIPGIGEGDRRCAGTPRISARAYCSFGGDSDVGRGEDRD